LAAVIIVSRSQCTTYPLTAGGDETEVDDVVADAGSAPLYQLLR